MLTDAETRCLLMVGNFLPPGFGSPAVGEALASHLPKHGWDVILTSHKINKFARLADMAVTTWRRRHDYQIAAVDVFSGAAFRWAEVTCSLLRRAEKPYLLTLHGGNLPVFAQGREARIRRLLQSADTVTTPSNYLKETLQTFRNDMILLPNPIDLEHLPYRPRTEPEPRLIWLRALHSIYNPVMAVEVLSRVRRFFPDAALWMIGPDKKDGSSEAVQERISRLGLETVVTLPGGVPKSEVGTWLNRGDIFLNTTTIDNTPVSVLEAMACGLCVVSTDAGGLPYLLRDHETALLVPSGATDAMSEAVSTLLRSPALAACLSRNAHHQARKHDWNCVLPQWIELLERTAALPRR